MTLLLPVVEGPGDERAVPALMRRVLHADGDYETQVLKAQRRGELPKVSASFDNWFRVALKEGAAIFWVLDFDCAFCHCAKKQAEALYDRSRSIRPNWPFRIAFMIREFETLFLADTGATREALSVPQGIVFPEDPEQVRNAKGWLSKALPAGEAYKPTVHQAKIVARLDLAALRVSSPSFRHFERAVLWLRDREIPGSSV